MIQLFAPAKINLFLDILARRADGFHDLHTVFLAVDLCDELEIEATGAGDLAIRTMEIAGPYAGGITPDGNNLVSRAVDFFRADFGDPAQLGALRVRLTKNIPHGAGLGGGSSDAAAMLAFLGRASAIDPARLYSTAARLGSDCAFFLGSPCAEGRGRGEILTPWPVRDLPLLIAVPDFAISTAAAYGALLPGMLGPQSDVRGLREWLEGKRIDTPRVCNTFEQALDSLHPTLPTIRETMVEHGATVARLSGSGSASFGIFPDEATRDAAARALAGTARCIPCRPRSTAP